MRRTQAYLYVKKSRVAELGDLLELLFPRSTRLRYVADMVLRLVREGRLVSNVHDFPPGERELLYDYRRLLRERGINRGELYSVLGKLRALGLVRKEGGHHHGVYKLSKSFCTRLRDIAEFWERWVEA